MSYRALDLYHRYDDELVAELADLRRTLPDSRETKMASAITRILEGTAGDDMASLRAAAEAGGEEITKEARVSVELEEILDTRAVESFMRATRAQEG